MCHSHLAMVISMSASLSHSPALRVHQPHPPTVHHHSVPEPMQLNSTRLTRAKRARYLVAGLSLLWHSRTFHQHLPSQTAMPFGEYPSSRPKNCYIISATWTTTQDNPVSVSALVNSGSLGNFISYDLLNCLHLLPRQARELRVQTIQRKPLGHGRVQFYATPLRLRIACLHEEIITFLVLDSLWISSWDASGVSILRKSDGNHVRSLAGACHAIGTVSPPFPYRFHVP